MFCPSCGQKIGIRDKFCNHCGTRLRVSSANPVNRTGVEAPPVYQAPQPPAGQCRPLVPQKPLSDPYFATNPMDYKTFYKAYAASGTKVWTTIFIVICFLTAAIALILVFLDSLLALLDIVVYLTFGILLLVNKNWLFALLPTIYCGFAGLLTMATSGTPSGIMALFAGISSAIALKKLGDAYKAYRLRGCLPQAPI